MPRKPLEVAVNPAVLRWARESAGCSFQEAVARLKIDQETLRGWESGEGHPPLGALASLADRYRRPLAALLLPEPPREPPPPEDFRALPQKRGRLASETLLAIRRARRLRSLAGELMQALGRPSTPQIGSASLRDDPEHVASGERSRLRVSLDEQIRWKTPYKAFGAWRSKLEEANLLVFQFAMPLEDCRGFSLAEQEPLAVVVNAADAIHARIFTLFHEYGHLLLRTPGICLPELKETRGQDERTRAEQWSHRFAGSLLLPAHALGIAGDVAASEQALMDSLADQSRRLKVSREVILRRMLDLGSVSRQRFFQVLGKLHLNHAEARRAEAHASPARRTVNQRGPLLSSLILEGLQRGTITYADAADYLSLRLKHLREVQSLLAA